MCGLCVLAALTVWKMSTPPSTLILSISVIQVMNTPLRDMPSLKELSKRDIYRRVLNAHPHDLMHLHTCTHMDTHMDTHMCACTHTHTFMDTCTHFADSLAHDHQRCLYLLLLLLHFPHHLEQGANWRTTILWPGEEVEEGYLKGRLCALQRTVC